MTGREGTIGRAVHMLWRNVGEEVILADTDREDFDLLSETAAAAWRCLDKPETLTQLTRSLADQYGLPPEAIQSDVASLVEDLVRRGAVVRTEDDDR